jgi:hypothetical protein
LKRSCSLSTPYRCASAPTSHRCLSVSGGADSHTCTGAPIILCSASGQLCGKPLCCFGYMHVISSRYGLDDLQENPAQVFGSSAFKIQDSSFKVVSAGEAARQRQLTIAIYGSVYQSPFIRLYVTRVIKRVRLALNIPVHDQSCDIRICALSVPCPQGARQACARSGPRAAQVWSL